MRSLRMLAVLGAALAAACATSPEAPVEVVGRAVDLNALSGEWAGVYSSSATGRSGTILFDLSLSEGSARGEVWMASDGPGYPERYPPDVPRPYRGVDALEVLTIRFVQVEGGLLAGVMSPYVDPATGGELRTVFRGRLEGDVITGTFESRNLLTGEESTGQWWVERKATRTEAR